MFNGFDVFRAPAPVPDVPPATVVLSEFTMDGKFRLVCFKFYYRLLNLLCVFWIRLERSPLLAMFLELNSPVPILCLPPRFLSIIL